MDLGGPRGPGRPGSKKFIFSFITDTRNVMILRGVDFHGFGGSPGAAEGPWAPRQQKVDFFIHNRYQECDDSEGGGFP